MSNKLIINTLVLTTDVRGWKEDEQCAEKIICNQYAG